MRPGSHLKADGRLDLEGALRLRVGGEILETTEDHPFWNATDQQWQRADALDQGDLLLTSSGGYLPIEGIVPKTARVTTAYNLTVTDIHTYYVLVGDTPVLAHNTCGNLFKGDGWQHVLYEHIDGSPGVAPNNITFSNYLDLDDIGDLIKETAGVRGVPNTPDPITGFPRDGTVHRVDFDYPVGSRARRP